MKKKVIIFNCPPRAGKDTIADIMCIRHEGVGVTKKMFKEKLFEIALVVSGVSKCEWDLRYDNMKDMKWVKLGGLSQREYLIKISEEWVKPVHGESYFGDQLVQSVNSHCNSYQYYLISDGGFEAETQAVVEAFGEDSVRILQWGRDGCSFENDSRDYIMGYPDITIQLPDNNDNVNDFVDLVQEYIFQWN